MKTKFILTICVGLLPLGLICTAPAAGTKGADEQAVRDADAQWSKAAGTKDLDKTVSFYSDDAVVLPPNGPSAKTKEAIRALWKDLIGSVTSVSWTATRVEMAKSGDMACLSGTYELAGLEPLLRRQGAQIGMDRADVWLALSDGGNGLEDFVERAFPRVEVVILDYWHASEYLADRAARRILVK